MAAPVAETCAVSPIERPLQFFESKLTIAAVMLVALIILLSGLGITPVSRTQEARVLETTRQMMGRDWRGWLVPILNGEPRLQKPPLAYWMTATSYLMLGVSEYAGRIPTATIGWLTLIATYMIARRAFDHRVAIVASTTLLGSHLFFRHVRLAETDAPATLFVTIGIGLVWRTAVDPRLRWFHLAAASTAMAILAKGAPAIFVVVFLVGFCAIEHRWDLLSRFVRSGAPLTLVAIALPWFAYVYVDTGNLHVVASELATTTTGRNHFNWPIVYFPMLLVILAPWSGFVPLALYDALRRWRSESSVRFILIWFGAIFLPLCLNGNKQIHYLLMLTPPLSILLARSLLLWPNERGWYGRVFAATAICIAFGAIAIPCVAILLRQRVFPADWLLATAIGAGLLATLRLYRRAGAQTATFALIVGVAIFLPIMEGLWIPSLSNRSMRDVAHEMQREFGDSQYVFYGPSTSLALCFELRTAIPTATTEDELLKVCTDGTIAITLSKAKENQKALPPYLIHQKEFMFEDERFDMYRWIGPSSLPAVLSEESAKP